VLRLGLLDRLEQDFDGGIYHAIHGLLNEYAGESICLREGKIAKIPTLTEGEWIDFIFTLPRADAVLDEGSDEVIG